MSESTSQQRLDSFYRKNQSREKDPSTSRAPISRNWEEELKNKISASKSIADIKNVFLDSLQIMSSIIQENQEIMEELRTLKTDLEKINSSYEQELKDLNSEVQENVNYKEFSKALDKIDDLENRSRRNNVRFHGIPEGEENIHQNTEVFIENFVRENLKINLPAESIQRAHRVGPRNSNHPRAIVANFQKFKDKDAVVKAGPKERPTFKGNKVFVNHDFSSIVMEKRKHLLPLLEEKRKENKRAWLHYDKLIYIEDGSLKALRVDSVNSVNSVYTSQ